MLSLNENLFLVEQNITGVLKETNGKIINEISDSIQVKALSAYSQSILTNCITNSIKYWSTYKNPITILSAEEDNYYSILNIEDNGMGIDLEKSRTKIFSLYNTFHYHKKAKGNGLYI